MLQHSRERVIDPPDDLALKITPPYPVYRDLRHLLQIPKPIAIRHQVQQQIVDVAAPHHREQLHQLHTYNPCRRPKEAYATAPASPEQAG